MKFFHHCKLSGHWEANHCQLHPEIHPKSCTSNRRVWKVNPNEYGEFFASPNQGEEVFQGEIETHKVYIAIKEDNRWIPNTKETPFKLLLTIFQNEFPFLKMYQRLMYEGQ
jgi:hypothetical protein